MDMQLGFREIDFFQTLAAKYQEFQATMGKTPQPEETKGEIEYTLAQALDDQALMASKSPDDINAILAEEEGPMLEKPVKADEVFGAS